MRSKWLRYKRLWALLLCLTAMVGVLGFLYQRSFHLDIHTPVTQGGLVLYHLSVDMEGSRASPPRMCFIRVLIAPHRSLKIPWAVHRVPATVRPVYMRLWVSVKLPDGEQYLLPLAPCYVLPHRTRLQRWWQRVMSAVGLFPPPSVSSVETAIPIAYPKGTRWIDLRVIDSQNGTQMARWRLLNPPEPPHSLHPPVRFQQHYATEGIRLHLDVYRYPRYYHIAQRFPPLWDSVLFRWKVQYQPASEAEHELLVKNIRLLPEWGYSLPRESMSVQLFPGRSRLPEKQTVPHTMELPFAAYQRALRLEADLEEVVIKQRLLHLQQIPLRPFTTITGRKLLVASPSRPVEVARIDGRPIVLLPVDSFYQQFLHNTPPPARGKVKVVGFLKGIPSGVGGFRATLRNESLHCWLTLMIYGQQEFHLLTVDFPPQRHYSTSDLTVRVTQRCIARTEHFTLTAPILPMQSLGL